MNETTQPAEVIRQVDEAADVIGSFIDQLVDQQVSHEDGKDLIDALFFCKVEIEAAIDKIELTTNDKAVVL